MQKQTNPKSKASEMNKLLQDPMFYFGLAGIIFVILFFAFAWPTYAKFVTTKDELQKFVRDIEGDKTTGQYKGFAFEVESREKDLIELKKQVDALNSEKNELFAKVFPEQEEIYYLTELLERYANDHHSENNPFVLNTISFGNLQMPQAEVVEGAPPPLPADVPYAVIQINLPVELSEDNFYKFMEFIKKSGSIELEDFYHGDRAVPLMTVDSLNYSYVEDQERPDLKKINANFILNAYVRVQPEAMLQMQ